MVAILMKPCLPAHLVGELRRVLDLRCSLTAVR
jgi:hypothetical protein